MTKLSAARLAIVASFLSFACLHRDAGEGGGRRTLRLAASQKVRFCKGEASNAHWSDNGKVLFYTCRLKSGDESLQAVEVVWEKGRLEIRAVPVEPAGHSAPPVVPAAAYPEAAFSPTGKQLAFVYPYRGKRNIMVKETAHLKRDGRVVTRWPFDTFAPSWSPDGKSLAFFTTYNPEVADETYSLILLPAEGDAPHKGLALAQKVLVTSVLPDAGGVPWWRAPGDEKSALLFFVLKDPAVSPRRSIGIHYYDTAKQAIFPLVNGSLLPERLRISQEGFVAMEGLSDEKEIFVSALVER